MVKCIHSVKLIIVRHFDFNDPFPEHIKMSVTCPSARPSVQYETRPQPRYTPSYLQKRNAPTCISTLCWEGVDLYLHTFFSSDDALIVQYSPNKYWCQLRHSYQHPLTLCGSDTTMVLVDGEAEDKLTNQHQLKLGLDYPIG